MAESEFVRITINYPRPIWIRLRRMYEAGDIESIQAATIQALEEFLIDKKGKTES